MKIAVTGTRGIYNIQGGVETHCEELYTRMASKREDVTVFRRKNFVSPSNAATEYRGVKLIDTYAPRSKFFEAFYHTFTSVFRAKRLHPDILHIHNIGPALLAPVARLLGMKVVVTVHSFNYDHAKWNKLAKAVLRLGERMTMHFANAVITISDVNQRTLEARYKKKVHLIYNGVNKPQITTARDYIDTLGLNRRPYMVALGRFTPEKGFHDLIAAYRQSGLSEKCALVIAGDADHKTDYTIELKRDAADAGVILTGFIKGERLAQVMSNASLFVMPSYNEGLPIALLEAMSYGLDVAVSDIEPNRLPMLDANDYFPVGNRKAIADKLREKVTGTSNEKRHYDLSAYNWDTITEQTLDVYRSVINA